MVGGVRPLPFVLVVTVFAIFTLALFQSVYNKLIGEYLAQNLPAFISCSNISSPTRLGNNRQVGVAKN